jgi:ribonucleoside-diphosphate reductase alpha chain
MSSDKYPEFNELALELLEARYLQPGESPDGLFWRVANHVARAEGVFDRGRETEYADKFHEIMRKLLFLPNSPTLMNAGTLIGQLSACFVIPLEDSLEGIFESIKNAALIQKTGGGVGYDFSPIRPKGDLVRSTGMAASGPMPFIKAFNTATEAVNQGGRRRGANMAVIRVDHPDIMDFIQAKRRDGLLGNFNLSVALFDEFFNILERGADLPLRNPRTGKVNGLIPARELLDAIVESAWECGEPGLLFIDSINETNPTPALGKIQATNPCGEQPLLPWESCNLGSINLAKMIKDGAVNWKQLAEVVHLAVRFLDDVIEANRFPMPQIEQVSLANRKIGLGVMGFADLLIELQIPYDSQKAVEVADRLMGFIQTEAKKASSILGRQRGDFPNFPESILAASWANMRNATVTSIAPTGSISLIAGCSQGIEPIFSFAQKRRFFGGREILQIHPAKTKAGGDAILSGTVAKYLCCAHEIKADWQIKILAAFQRHVDNGVSKTVNLPAEARRGEIEQAIMNAHALGCKGVTFFRDKCRKFQVLEQEQTPQKYFESGGVASCSACG